MKQVIKHRDGGLLNMIRRTDPKDTTSSSTMSTQIIIHVLEFTMAFTYVVLIWPIYEGKIIYGVTSYA